MSNRKDVVMKFVRDPHAKDTIVAIVADANPDWPDGMAERVVSGAPRTVLRGAPEGVAAEFAERLSACGAEIEIHEH